MAKFILGNGIRKAAQRQPWLGKLLWGLDYLVVASLVKLLGLLPVDTASALGRGLGRLFARLVSRKNDKIRENLQRALPDKSPQELDRLVSDVWGSGGAVLAEYAHLDFLSRKENGRLDIRVLEPIPAYSDASSRAVFVSAHQSNWELAGSAIAQFGIKFVCLYSPPFNPWLDTMLKTSRQAIGCELLPRDMSMRPLIRALSDQRSVAMVVDRRTDEGEPIPFFGCAKPTTLLPAKLALKYRCPLVPIRVERLRGARYRVTFYPPIQPSNPDAGETAQAVEMMTTVNGLFEDWIRASPGEWFCSKRIWPKRRMGAASQSAGQADGQ